MFSEDTKAALERLRTAPATSDQGLRHHVAIRDEAMALSMELRQSADFLEPQGFFASARHCRRAADLIDHMADQISMREAIRQALCLSNHGETAP